MHTLSDFMNIKNNRWWVVILSLAIIAGIAMALSIFPNISSNHHESKDIKRLKDMGVEYIRANRADSAIKCFMEVIDEYHEGMSKDDKIICAKAFNNLGYIYSQMYSDYSGAYSYLLKSLEIAENVNYPRQYALIYINLGNIYMYFEDYENAGGYYRKAYEAAKENEDWDLTNHALSNLLLTAHDTLKKDDLTALINDYMHLNLPPNDEATEYTKKLCAVTAERFNPHRSNNAYYRDLEQLIYDYHLDERSVFNLNFIKYEQLLKEGQSDEVIDYMKDILKNKTTTKGDEAAVMKGISSVYELKGLEDSAHIFKVKSILIRDSLMKQESYATIRNMHSSYNLRLFEREINKSEIIQKNQLVIIILCIVWGIVLSIVTTMLIRKNKRLNETLTALYNKNVNSPATLPGYNTPAQIPFSRNITPENFPECNESGNDSLDDEASLPKEEQSKLVLDDETTRLIAEDILHVMNDKEIIGKCDFTIRKLAETTGHKERYVSNVINEYFHKNFNGLLNEYRIVQAKKILDDGNEASKITIEGLALSLGFKSRSNFAAVFKKLTGLTPKEYRNIAQSKSND